MKKFLSIILAILMIVTTVPMAFAAEGSEEGNVAISLDENGVMLISGAGALTYYDTVDIAAFVKENSDEIMHIEFGEGITEIPEISQSFFMILETVETVSLPATVEKIDPGFFCIAMGIKEYIVSPENDKYLSEGGVIFNSDKTVLVAYPTSMKTKEYTVPEGVVTIGKRAFYFSNIEKLIPPSTLLTVEEDAFNMSRLKEFDLPVGLVTISENAFRMTLLENVEIPETVEYIGELAFAYISPLKNVTINKDVRIIEALAFCPDRNRITVHYPGTTEEWNNIEKGMDCLGYSSTLHLGESIIYKDAKEVTCGQDGNEAGYFCTECDAYVSGKHFTATGDHSFEKSVCTVCGYICEHKNLTDGFCQDCETFLYAITHQPTSGQPYVELSDDAGASYQWYEGTIGPIPVTDENATGDLKDFDEPSHATYNKETGWWTSESDRYFAIELKYGQTMKMEFNQKVNSIIYCYTDGYGTAGRTEYPGSTEYTFVAETSATYMFRIWGTDSNPANLAVRATVEDFVYTPVSNWDGPYAGITDCGKSYYCLVTFADGSTEKSDAFIDKYAISDQPDETELNVNVNVDEATYQWYKVNLGEEITDENAYNIHSFSGFGYEYTPEKGWRETTITKDDSDFFAVKLQAGEPITVFVDGVVKGSVVLLDPNRGGVAAEAAPNADNTYILRPEESGIYLLAILATGDDVTVRAFFGEAEFIEIEGATDNTYYPEEDGNYCCKVTFEDGTTEKSSCVYYCPHNGETDIVNDVNKTCTDDGYTGDTACSICGKILAYGEAIPASHEIKTVDAKAPTCTEIGWEAYEYCTNCDYTTYKEIPATGEHIDADGDTMCDNGGEQLTCPDCKRPVHADTLIQNIVCLIFMFINLIKTAF